MIPWDAPDAAFDLDRFITESNRIDPQHDLSGALIPGDRPGTWMFDNQLHAWAVLDDALATGRRLSRSLVLDVHRELTRGVDRLETQRASGQYRTREVWIDTDGGRQATLHPMHIEPVMDAWCARVEALLQAVPAGHEELICWRAHADFECIHPFLDGNGRTGRLLLLYTLRRAGHPGVVIPYEERGAYYAALRTYAREHYRPDGRVRLDADPADVTGELHVYPLTEPHGTAAIVGDTAALTALRDALNAALLTGAANSGHLVSDGKAFMLTIRRRAPGTVDAAPSPYLGTVPPGLNAVLWPEDT